MLGRVLSGGALGVVRERVSESGFYTEYSISFPADLVLVNHSPDERDGRVRKVSAEPLNKTKSSQMWPNPEGGELELSLTYFGDRSDFLKNDKGLQTLISIDAVKTLGMREHWGGVPTRRAEVLLADLGRPDFPPFFVSHGWSSTTVSAHLRDHQRAQQEFMVWLDLLQEKGVITFPVTKLHKQIVSKRPPARKKRTK